MVRRSDLEIGRRRLRRFVYVIAAVIAVAFGASRFTAQSEPRPGSKVVSKHGKPWRIAEVPTNYRAVFRIDTYASGKANVTTEKVWVRRPFESRIETFKGETPGTAQPDVRQSAFGVLTSVSPRSAPLNVAVAPSLASGDLRIDDALRDGIRRKVLQERERRRVYGHECQVYRAGGPISAGDLTKYTSGGDEYADFCVDRSGIVVEEWWVSKGHLLRRRVATSLHVGGRIDSSLFAITAPEGSTPQRGAISRISPSEGPSKLWTLTSPPKGFRYLGRFVVIRPQAAQSPMGSSDLPTISTTDAFVRGPDLITVDQNPSLATAAAAENRPTFDVKVRGFKKASLVLDGRMNEIRIATPDNSYVRIVGTVSPERLIALAGELQLVRS